MLIKLITSKEYEKFANQIKKLIQLSYLENFSFDKKILLKEANEKSLSLSTYIQEDSAKILCAINNDMVLGFVWLYEYQYYTEKRFHVNQIVVSPEVQGKGIAKKLLFEAEKVAMSEDISTIDLNVSEENQVAIKLYEKLDFNTERRHLTKRLEAN